VETHTVFPIKGPQHTDHGSDPLAVDGTVINFSPFSWYIRLPGQDACNQARKEWVSLTPEIKMGVLLGRSPAGRQALATWAFEVVPSGMPLRGRDISLDMRLLVVSIETPGLDGFESMAEGLSCPLG
jgi:hypothetical protein